VRNPSWKDSFRHAFEGMVYVVRTQRNAHVELVIAGGVILLGLFAGLDALAWAVVILTMGFVLCAEWFNTAIETLTDLACPQVHPLAKITKDVSAAAVLLASIFSVIIGLLVIGPPLLSRLF
jgi:diacylglycerol kinase